MNQSPGAPPILIDADLSLYDDPYRSFEAWYDAAAVVDPQPHAMALATVDAAGRPTVRMVLYRGRSAEGFRFFTNYDSPKAQDLEARCEASLLFYWQPLRRQVRIEGRVEKLPGGESDEYFAGRDRESQLGAWASRQSAPIPSRKALLERMEAMGRRFGEGPVPRPEFWGGYRLEPERFEFWQNRENRLHDRYSYTPHGEAWQVQRLSP